MSKVQTRRSVSLSRAIYTAITAEAARRDMSAAHYVESLIRAAIPGLPETNRDAALAKRVVYPLPRVESPAVQSRSLFTHGIVAGALLEAAEAEAVEQKRRDNRAYAASVRKRWGDTAPLVERLRRKAKREIGYNRDYSPRARERHAQKVSLRFGELLRQHGLLLPENEGYAPGSWAAPSQEVG